MNKFISHEVYDNSNFKDVLFQPFMVTEYKDYTLLSGQWYTRGTAGIYATVTQVIKVDKDDYNDWFTIDIGEL